MIRNARAWVAAHPGTDAAIQFNWPPRVGLIAPISEAVKERFVSTNPAGLELLKAMWRWDVPSEPTATMCRFVMDHLDDPEIK